ncbi:hypothetical protein AWC38_SpisGene10654 [Stylophora pistillata]|uniref:Uncharacterized protein n=1 Tax=Stylophora pistillata TaxID=50429 RepID=A0A2B4S6T1_STYPI|nr:hypothetical protein AWC38_SpisGene10654 [Stylophora pistillata]
MTSNLAARVDENGKTASDVGDWQTPAIPMTSDSAARVDESEKTAYNRIDKHQRFPLQVIQQHVLMKETKQPKAQTSILCCHSFDKSVEAMKQQHCGVIQTLQELDSIHNDATAAGLLKKMKNAKFIGALYILAEVLPVLSSLSHTFRSSNINFSLIQPQIKATKQHLNRIVEDDIPMEKLQADVDSFTNLGCDITFPPTLHQQMQSLTQKNVAALSNNLDQRFVSSSDVISALSIFDPVNVPAYEADGFQEFGHSSVNILAKHFFQIETEEVQKLKSEKLLAEWSHMKYHVNDNIKKMIPIEVKSGSSRTTTTECNAWPERGASAVKNVKTRLRSRLQNDMLRAILAVGINGPGVQSCLPVVKEAARVWLEAKERRKLPKVPKSDNPTSEPSLVIVQCETKEMGEQCEREETIAVQSGTAVGREHEENVNEEDLDEVLEALNLQSKGSESDTDCDCDSAFGSDNDDLAF